MFRINNITINKEDGKIYYLFGCYSNSLKLRDTFRVESNRLELLFKEAAIYSLEGLLNKDVELYYDVFGVLQKFRFYIPQKEWIDL